MFSDPRSRAAAPALGRLSLVCWLAVVAAGHVSAANVTVGCGSVGGFDYSSINAALTALHAISFRDHTITVSGDCSETIFIGDFVNLSLIGTPGASILHPSSSGGPVLHINGSTNVRIQGFTIRGSGQGADLILIFNNSLVRIVECIIERGQQGMFVNNMCQVNIERSTIQDNVSNGIRVSANSLLSLGTVSGDTVATVVQRNGGQGVQVDDNAMAQIYGNTILKDNRGAGLNLTGGRARLCCNEGQRQLLNNRDGIELTGGTVHIDGPAIIKDHVRAGISAFGATVAISGPVVIEGNKGVGILLLGSSATIGQGQTIRSNGSGLMSHGGIAAARTSNLSLFSSQVVNNNGQGIYVGENSMAALYGNTITGNSAEGVRVWRLSTTWLSVPANVLNNNGGVDFFCAENAHGFGTKDGVGRFFCPGFDALQQPGGPGPPWP